MANSYFVVILITKYLLKSLLKYFSDLESKKTYSTAIELLNYAMTETWPDIASAILKVTEFAANLRASYLEVTKYIFWYINNT